MERTGHLELHHEPSGLRHFLLGRPLVSGDAVELLLGGGVWVAGHYEWSHRPADPPSLWIDLGGPWEDDPGAPVPRLELRLPRAAQLRWLPPVVEDAAGASADPLASPSRH